LPEGTYNEASNTIKAIAVFNRGIDRGVELSNRRICMTQREMSEAKIKKGTKAIGSTTVWRFPESFSDNVP
jgi:hypothetical protein